MDVLELQRKAKPKWIKAKLPTTKEFGKMRQILGNQSLHTVCEEAFCPNCTECWESGTATFLLMGDICTRGCRFCDVRTGNPRQILDQNEPINLAHAVRDLGLTYVVLTSVDRDDLRDGGANHLKNCIESIRELNPGVLIEILIPDFKGDIKSLKIIVKSKPNVIGHNIETTRQLTPKVRDKRASFEQSIRVLKNIKNLDPTILTKSSIMLGLGESDEQILDALKQLKKVNVDIVTLGQYLQPSKKNLEVVEYVEPEKFRFWERIASEMGFLYVASGPLVRSSYRAGEFYLNHYLNKL